MTRIRSRFSDKMGGSSAAFLASSSIHLFMAKASRGSVFLLFTRSPSWTWLLLSLQPVPIRKGSHATGRPPLLTNSFEPSCSILHSGKAGTEFGLLCCHIEQRTLSPIVSSSITFQSLDSLQCSQGQRCRLCALAVCHGF
jgi:hypothetical protein